MEIDEVLYSHLMADPLMILPPKKASRRSSVQWSQFWKFHTAGTLPGGESRFSLTGRATGTGIDSFKKEEAGCLRAGSVLWILAESV